MQIAAVQTALPPHRYAQEEIEQALQVIFERAGLDQRKVSRLHRRVGVSSRALAVPLERYPQLDGFDASNAAWVECATALGATAVEQALRACGLSPSDVDAVFFTTVTGLAVPSIDARVAAALGMRPEVKRVPLFGLGCLGGAAGLARMYDYLRAWPDHVAVLLSVELCSLTLQREDSTANAIACALFGDGAAAVVGVGRTRAGRLASERRMPEVRCSRSAMYPNTHDLMGWDIGAHGFRIVLSPEVPRVVHEIIAPDIRRFLADHDLEPSDVGTWVCHPGGPKVLLALQEALGLERDALALTWKHLGELGNLSSASVLFVLQETLRERPMAPRTPGVLLAMGPGFSAEIVLFEW